MAEETLPALSQSGWSLVRTEGLRELPRWRHGMEAVGGEWVRWEAVRDLLESQP
jgi:hypothetical protein